MELTVVFEYYEAPETYSRIWVPRGYGNIQSYLSTKMLSKHTVVFEYHEAMETYSRIWVLQGFRNLQSYLSTTGLKKLTVVLEYTKQDYCETHPRYEFTKLVLGQFGKRSISTDNGDKNI